MSNKINVQRYNPELDWSDCYYEGDSPYVAMENCDYGEYVRYEDYKILYRELEELRKLVDD